MSLWLLESKSLPDRTLASLHTQALHLAKIETILGAFSELHIACCVDCEKDPGLKNFTVQTTKPTPKIHRNFLEPVIFLEVILQNSTSNKGSIHHSYHLGKDSDMCIHCKGYTDHFVRHLIPMLSFFGGKL